MLDATLHVADPPAGIAFEPGAIEVLGCRPELHYEIAGEVLLAPFLTPETARRILFPALSQAAAQTLPPVPLRASGWAVAALHVTARCWP